MSAYLAFATATALLAFTPGPNTMLIVARTTAQGRIAGSCVVLGIELGFLVHLVASALGLTALLLAIPKAYGVLRITGTVYLLYLAYRIIADRGDLIGPNVARRGTTRLIASGFLSNALNPKTAAFYLAIFPQFISAGQVSVAPQVLGLGALHISVSTVCNLLWVSGAGGIVRFLRTRPRLDLVRRGLFGGIIAGLALRLLAQREPVRT
jgi:threonine/homoserine/homoserine lactone efflux protein